MKERVAFIDAVLLARDFVSGDVVRKSNHKDNLMTPFVGRVVYSNPAIGRVMVQWPWGVEQESPMELIRELDPAFGLPVSIDQSYSTWEKARLVDGKEQEQADAKWRKSLSASVASAYEDRTLPLWREACRMMHAGNDEIQTYMALAAKMAEDFGDDAIKLTVSNLFEHGRQLAIYWKDKKRRYKVTQQEKDSKRLACPRCRGLLKPRTYRQGRRFLLCKDCGFSIHPKDLLSV